ncbi:MAG: hypothetical protein ACPG32_00430 [Akkermansiaceae bacterium]
MLRKVSAVTLLLVMTLLITLKHPVLGYCLCVDSFFAGDCSCEVAQKAQKKTSSATQSCSHCCQETACNTPADGSLAPAAPCDDCSKRLSIDVDDFVWNGTVQVPNDPQLLDDGSSHYGADLVFSGAQAPAFASGPIRGDPPPHSVAIPAYPGLPVYLRYSVLRL